MRNVVKLGIKCILVLVPLWVVSLVMAMTQISFVDWEIPNYWWNRQACEQQDKYYKAIVIGDSSANAAYMPEVISDEILNLAMGGTSTVEMYYTLEDYLNNNEAPTDVFLSFHDSHLYYSEVYTEKILPAHRFSLATNLRMIADGTLKRDATFGATGLLSEALTTEIYFPSQYIVSFVEGLKSDRTHTNTDALATIELHNGRYTALGKTEFTTTQTRTYQGYSGQDLYIEYLNKIAALCQDRDIKLHIIKLPLPENTKFSDDYYTQIWAFYASLCLMYDVMDFHWDWDQQIYPNEAFADEIHMNNAGSYEFSTYVRDLYQEVFDSIDMNSDMMLALDDTVSEENTLYYLLEMVQDKNYTLLVYDKNKYIYQLKKDFLNDRGIWLSRATGLKTSDDNKDCLYYCKCDGVTKPNLTIRDDGGSMVIQMEGQEDVRWFLNTTNRINLAIVDNDNGCIVATNNIVYDEAKGFNKYIE